MSEAEFIDEMSHFERWDREFRPVKAWYWLLRRVSEIRRVRRKFREFFVRGRRGWAPSDTWSLDKYLARVMGESLRFLADHGHGWPGEESEWKTMDDWNAELERHAALLIAYSNDADPPDIGPTLQRLSTFWGQLWD